MRDNRNTAPTFGSLLRRFREAAGWSQEDLAERAGLSTKAISALERGERRRPYPATVQRLASALTLSDADRSALLAALRSREVIPPLVPMAAGKQTPERRLRLAPLPAPLTPLVDRERDVRAVVDLLRHECVRLLTLLGAGGVGKTRLAIEVGHALQADFPDGVAFVPLAPLSDAALVLPTMAEAIGMRQTGQLLERDLLVVALSGKRMLVVLDNCEHVLAAAAELAALLEACPQLVLLATSRAALRLRGEHGFPVMPLGVPALASVPSSDEVRRSPAAQLFLQRAQAVSPSFTLTHDNAAAVAAICRRLDGLPLALELAAARVKLLSPTALLARLDRVLPLLTGGARDLPERQRTLRDAIAWSYDLLEEDDRRLFRRLAIFAGGCMLEAAIAVCGDVAGESTVSDVLLGMDSLLEKSLIERDAASEWPRFRTLELLREFGLEQLAIAGESAVLQRQHALYVLDLVESLQASVQQGDPQAIRRLDWEHDNVRAALRWAQEGGAVEFGLRLSSSFRYFWQARGHLSEGRAWLQAFLAVSTGDEAPGIRAKALNSAGGLMVLQRDYRLAIPIYEESLALYRSVGDPWGEAALILNLAYTFASLGEYDRAAPLLEQAMELARRGPYPANAGIVMGYQATVAQHRGDLGQAAALYERSIATLEELDERWWLNYMVTRLGDLLRQLGSYDRAAVLFERSLQLSHAVGDRQSIATTLCHLGRLQHEQGAYEPAAATILDAMGMLQSLGDLAGVALCLDRLAGVAQAMEKPEAAARLGGAAATLRARIDVPATPDQQAETAQSLSAARDTMGAREFALAWEEGTKLTPERAAAEVCERAGIR